VTVAAWRRARATLSFAATCAVLLGATLVLVAVGGPAQLSRLSAQADAAMRATSAVPTPPSATATPFPPPVSVDEVRADLARMLDVTLTAAVGPVADPAGAALAPDALVPVASACQESGTRLGLALDIRTADNAASVTRILAAWDAEGYSPDRAMQEDLRYDEAAPVESLSIRDTSTIDGLLHLRIQGRCATAE
jgi:hypothetical protein